MMLGRSLRLVRCSRSEGRWVGRRTDIGRVVVLVRGVQNRTNPNSKPQTQKKNRNPNQAASFRISLVFFFYRNRAVWFGFSF